MEVFRQLRLRLRNELNQEPDATTVSLLRSLREKRAEPNKPDIKQDHKASASYRSRGLPVPRTRLIGRTEAVNDVRARLAEQPQQIPIADEDADEICQAVPTQIEAPDMQGDWRQAEIGEGGEA